MLLHHGNVEEKCENNKDVVRLSKTGVENAKKFKFH